VFSHIKTSSKIIMSGSFLHTAPEKAIYGNRRRQGRQNEIHKAIKKVAEHLYNVMVLRMYMMMTLT
jgi:hypothetical protein